jgi:hypothetical protein
MTVKELKEALRNVPNEVEVSILIDSWESESREPWMARYLSEKDEEGNVSEEFRINC